MADAACVAVGSCLLASCLMSEKIIADIQDEELTNEAHILALIEFVAKSALETLKAYQAQSFDKFDSNPADDACQSRAAILLDLSTKDLLPELVELGRVCKQIQKSVNTRKNSVNQGKSVESVQEFFQKNLSALKVSYEVEFLIQARVLKVLRQKVDETPEGLAITKTDSSLISKLGKNMAHFPTRETREIVSHLQVRHSEQSIEMMHQLAMSALARETSLPENTVRYTSNEAYVAKHFSCHYFEVLTLFDLIECNEAIVELQVHESSRVKSFSLYFDQGTLIDSLPLGAKVVVIQAGVRATRDEIIEEIGANGLREAILSQASFAPPFHPKSILADIKVKEAREHIELSRRTVLLKTVQIDHIYLDQVQTRRLGR